MVVTQQMTNIFLGSRKKIIRANDVMAVIQKTLTKMTTDKARATGHQHCLTIFHVNNLSEKAHIDKYTILV
jgi:hypothetical protein